MTNREFADAFGSQVTKGTTSEADIAGHYPYSPERWRVFVDGTRQFVQYGNVSQYNDIVDGHELMPAQGETVSLTTTERFRYVVGYVIEPSFAYQFNRSLESGDKAVIGYGDPDLTNDMADADGWFWIYTPDLDDDEVTISEYRAGTEVDSDTVSLEKSLTIWKRLAIRLNWYNVGEAKWIETYTNNGNQINATQGATSVDNGKGPEVGNHPVTFSVQRGESSSALTLEAGSAAVQTLGDVTAITRSKIYTSIQSIDSANTWVPLQAIRVDPDREIINTQLKRLRPSEYSADADVRMMASAFDSTKVADSGGNAIVDGDWSTPFAHNAQNSVVETTTEVAQFADSSGTLQTSTTDPGGYQVGFGTLTSTGVGGNARQAGDSLVERREISSRDIIVLLAFATGTGDLTYDVSIGQDW